MEYTGKLYGKIGEIYFDTDKTSNDWDKLELENKQLKKLLETQNEIHTEILTDKALKFTENLKLQQQLTEANEQIRLMEIGAKSFRQKIHSYELILYKNRS